MDRLYSGLAVKLPSRRKLGHWIKNNVSSTLLKFNPIPNAEPEPKREQDLSHGCSHCKIKRSGARLHVCKVIA